MQRTSQSGALAAEEKARRAKAKRSAVAMGMGGRARANKERGCRRHNDKKRGGMRQASPQWEIIK